jgi:O-antigen/teichoic acid export membrane protein
MAKNQIKIGAILSYVQMALSIIIGLSYTPIMIRLLGQSEYGLYSAVSSVTAILSVLNLGFSSAYQRYYSKYKKENDEIKLSRLNGLFLIIFLVMGFVALVAGLSLLFNIELLFDSGLTQKEYQTAQILLAILIVQLTLFFPTSVFTSIISAHEKFIFAKSLQIAKTLLSPLITLPLLLMGYKSIALVSVSCVISIFSDLTNVFFALLHLKEKFRFGRIEAGLFKELLTYISFIALHLITDQINWNIDKILLGRFKGTESVAIYSVGYSIYSYMIYLGTPIASLFIPKVHRIAANTSLTKEGKTKEYTSLFIKISRIQSVLIGCVVSGFLVFGQSFLQLWVGDGYSASFWVAALLMLSGSIDLIQVLGIEIQRAQNLHRFRGIVYIIMAIINCFISIPLCMYWGAVGSAFGTCLSLVIVQGLIINIYLHKRCHINIVHFWKSITHIVLGIIPPFIIGLIVTHFVEMPSWMTLVAGILVYCMIYTGSIWFISLNHEEKNMLLSIFKKRRMNKNKS